MKKSISTRLKLMIAVTPIAFALMFVFAADSKSSMASLKSNRVPASKADAASNYAKYCTRCHGGDGRSQTAKGKQTRSTDLTKSSVSDAKGIRIIANGAGSMPGFKDNMSAEDIRALMGYVRGFRR